MSSIEKAVERIQTASEKAAAEKKAKPRVREEPTLGTADGPELAPFIEGAAAQDADYPSTKVKHHLNLSSLERQGYLTPKNSQSQLAEEFRLLKRPLLRNAFGKNAAGPIEHSNLIMVTSAMPGEGKTFTSLNLAMSMAMELDSTVLIIDCDVIKPALTKMLGLEGAPGLTDVLLDTDVQLSDAIVNTDLPKLRVLPAGRIHSQSTELLASEQMEQLARELSQRYPDRVILFDSPPLLATSQASVLAHLMGQILMVVEAGRTPQHVVKEAVALLDDTKVIGMALNKSPRSYNKEIYGGYYGSYGS
jgi:exopolysaccharide/PEP-CTERM locus tyrosine autokinase